MFEKKKCKNCGEKIKEEWNFCPYCGEGLKAPFPRKLFGNTENEFKKLEKTFVLPKLSAGPRGITITISSRRPRIEKRRVEPKKIEVKKPLRVAKTTKEPETKINKTGNRQIIEIKLPEVKSQDDIEINVFEQSMEIKAFAGDKGYFKLVPIPTNAEILRKEFKNNILKIEVVK